MKVLLRVGGHIGYVTFDMAWPEVHCSVSKVHMNTVCDPAAQTHEHTRAHINTHTNIRVIDEKRAFYCKGVHHPPFIVSWKSEILG